MQTSGQLIIPKYHYNFSHPDYHRRFRNFTESVPLREVADCHRRKGISPCPEVLRCKDTHNFKCASYFIAFF